MRIGPLEAVIALVRALNNYLKQPSNFPAHRSTLVLGFIAFQNDIIVVIEMTEQSPQPSHELARDTDSQQPEHEPPVDANETFPPVENKALEDVAHDKYGESRDATGKERNTEARDVKNEESNDKKSGHDENNGEEEEDDDDEADDDDEDDEDDEDDDEDEEDEEPRLKYARLTQHLNGVYRNGDATSAFLVAGDKMVGCVCVGAYQLANAFTDSWNA